MPPPFGALRFLYVGTGDIAKDLAFYCDKLGAEKLWHFKAFGAEVAALRLGEGPLYLLADHRPAPSCIPIYEVEDLKATAKALKKRGWKPEGEPVEVPNGPCYVFHDPSGNPVAFLEDVRPGLVEGMAEDEANPRAVREG